MERRERLNASTESPFPTNSKLSDFVLRLARDSHVLCAGNVTPDVNADAASHLTLHPKARHAWNYPLPHQSRFGGVGVHRSELKT